MDFLPIWEFSRRFYKIDNPKSHFPERRCENQTSAGGAKYISLRIFLCSDCLSFLVQKSSWIWCTIEFFGFFWMVSFFSGKQWLSNWVVIYPELQQRLVCWIEQLQSSRPCRSRWMFKSLKKSVFLFFFFSSWFPETSGYFLPSLPSNKSSIRRTIYPYEMLNEQWKLFIGIVKCECWLRLGEQSILVRYFTFLPPFNLKIEFIKT